MSGTRTVILGTARTPFGKLGGGLSTVAAVDLGAAAIAGALERAGVDPGAVDHVIMGQVLQAGQGQVPSRQAQIRSGIPEEVSSETVNKVCASGLRAVALLDQAIRAGDVEVGVGGGMESMSRAPHLLQDARFGYRMGSGELLDAMVHDGLTNAFSGRQMFDEATEVGDELGLGRAALDAWALRSQKRAVGAVDAGRLAQEITPLTVPAAGRGRGETVIDTDEGPRRGGTAEALAALPGLVGRTASHTAGNSPGVNDGAAAIVVSSGGWAAAHGHRPLAEIVAHAQSANETPRITTAPSIAVGKVLTRAGLRVEDVDLWEINEAFASVAVHTVRELLIDQERVNVNGGAVALGHPIGASGARIIGALVQELGRRGGGLGCATICSGGGQGDALLVRVGASA